MKKALLLLVGLLTAAICEVASAPALADTPCGAENLNSNKYCLHYELLTSPFELELISTGLFLFTQEKAQPHELAIQTATPTVISCTTGAGEANTEADGIGSTVIRKAKIGFAGCEITSANKAECEVDLEIKAQEIDGLSSLQFEEEVAETPINRVDTLFSIPGGGTFATFTIKSKEGKTCTQAQSKGKVKGEELCFWLQNSEEALNEDRETHLLQCVPGGLTFAGTTAGLLVEWEVLLLTANGVGAEDDKWAIIETEF